MHACLLLGMLVALVCPQEELSSLQGELGTQCVLQPGLPSDCCIAQNTHLLLS